jgi:hypothetical protein
MRIPGFQIQGTRRNSVNPSIRRAYQVRGADIWPIGIPPARIQSQQPDALSPENGQMIRLPGVNFPPAGAVAVDTDGDADIAPGASATLLSVPVPNGSRLRVVGIGFSAGDETALKFLSWSIQINTDTVPGYTLKNAVIGSIVQLTDIFQVASGSTTLSVVGTASALAVVTYRYICRIRGHFYAEKED